MKHAVAIVAGLLLVLSIALLLAGCGPSKPPPKDPSFFLIFENASSSTQKVTVTYWYGDFASSSSLPIAAVTSHTETSFRFNTLSPDLIDVRAGWGHASWSGPELKDVDGNMRGKVMRVRFPDAVVTWEF